MFPFQVDFHKIAQALELTKQTMKGEETIPPSAIKQLETAQKQYEEALYYNITCSNRTFYY